MTEVVATTAGLFPPAADAEAARLRALAWQTETGLDRLVEGQRGWDGLTAPLRSCESVVDPGDGRPAVREDLSATGRLAAELRAARECVADETAAMQAVVPGPHTLAGRVDDEWFGDRAALVEALGEWLAAELRRCPAVETTLVVAPGLVESPPPDGLDARASAALDTLADGAPGSVAVYPPGGAVTEKTYAHLMDADVTALGVDLCADHERALYLVNEYGTTDDLVVGVADATDDGVESAGTLADRVEWWRSNTPAASFERLYATLSGSARGLGVPTLRGKLAALSAV